jgi:hypothetical protein
MLRQDTTRRTAVAAQTIVLVGFVFLLLVFAVARFSADLRGSDFPDFYVAAKMLAEGRGHQLYDADVQRQYQARYGERIGTLYIHPPFETILYLAVAWLPMRYAYLLWSLVSVGAFAATCRLLADDALKWCNWRVLLAASFIFVPLILCIRQGQDSLLLLLLLVLVFKALRRNRGFAAGCWLGAGLLKFQLVLPMLLALLLRSPRAVRQSMAKGFGLVMAALVIVSAAITGLSGFRAYPALVLHLREQPLAGVFAPDMANLRGLVYIIFRNNQSAKAISLLSISSVVALLIAVLGHKNSWLTMRVDSTQNARDDFNRVAANTVLFGLLVSYYLNPHDLTALLLPLTFVLERVVQRRSKLADWMTAGLAGILFLPPLHLWALQAKAYAVLSIPMLMLFVTTSFSAPK